MKGEATLAELAQRFDVHPHQIGQWREQLLSGAAAVFAEGRPVLPGAHDGFSLGDLVLAVAATGAVAWANILGK